jgi:AbrB family looped-hinge helix DNA binding protein
LAQITVDEKDRIILPKEIRKRLGISPGSKLQVEQRGNEIAIRPAVPVADPTKAMWGLAGGAVERNPKKRAREAIAQKRRHAG